MALYTSGKGSNTVVCKLKQDFSKDPNWFYENFMVLMQINAPISGDSITNKNISE